MAQKRRRRRKMVRMLPFFLILCVLAAGGGAGYYLWRHISQDTAGELKSADMTAEKRALWNQKMTEAEEICRKAAEEYQVKQERLDFAVQPGRIPGTDTETDEKVMYLTLDDGPSYNTPAVLDILDRYHVKATFFVTNEMPEYAYLIKEAYDRGHTIGLHTYSHNYASVYASVEAYFQDLDAIGKVVCEQIGYVPCFIRFPGGSSNTISANYMPGIMTQLADEVHNRGYQYYDWNASSGDGSVLGTEELVANATRFTENNLVLLSHDAAAKETTVEALPRIIEYYQSQGYVFKALDREAYAPHHGINN